LFSAVLQKRIAIQIFIVRKFLFLKLDVFYIYDIINAELVVILLLNSFIVREIKFEKKTILKIKRGKEKLKVITGKLCKTSTFEIIFKQIRS
jgi:hypothetical protein